MTPDDPPATTDGTPDVRAAREHVIRTVVAFARTLRGAGAAVPANAALPATEALAEIGLDDRERVRAALHAAFVTDPRDGDHFEEHFPSFWYRLRTGLEATAAHDDAGDRAESVPGDEATPTTDVEGSLSDASIETTLTGDGNLADGEGTVESRRVSDTDATDLDAADSDDQRPGTYSAAGESTPIEDETVGGVTAVDAATMRRFEATLATLSGRRWSSRGDESIDARRALRDSMETGGVTLSMPTRGRTDSAFRVCVLVDVSRSVLDAIDRGFLLSVLSRLVADSRSTRVFFFDTDIREVTDVFADQRGDPAEALERAEVAWGGGTRIGTSLATLRRQWPTAVDRRTVTLVISDGLEVGEVDELEAGISWLARQSRALLWLNPLATSTAWEPTCRGMVAVEPYVDGVFAFGASADLEDAARQLARHGFGGSVGYEHDFRDRSGGAST